VSCASVGVASRFWHLRHWSYLVNWNASRLSKVLKFESVWHQARRSVGGEGSVFSSAFSMWASGAQRLDRVRRGLAQQALGQYLEK
jgi:hypothetical protein